MEINNRAPFAKGWTRCKYKKTAQADPALSKGISLDGPQASLLTTTILRLYEIT